MAKTKFEFLQRLREIAAKELDALPDTLAAMTPDKRAGVAIKLLSMTMEGDDLFSDEKPKWYAPLPASGEQEATAAK